MNILHEKFCILPWISVETTPIGTVRPCCLATSEILDENSVAYDVSNDSLQTIRDSKSMEVLRQAFLDGVHPDICERCWAEEDANRTSKRIHMLDKLKHIIPDNLTSKPKPLSFIDLKLGNICNISCRICGSWSSSTYASEELKQLPKDKRKESFAYEMNRAGAWPRKVDTFWDELLANASDIKYLEITGGEPFMIKEHFDFLEKLVKLGYSNDIEIHYNTNGTIYPEQAYIWSHFKHVEIAFSIDDIGDRFEYQRNGANWNSVVSNISRFKQLRKDSDNISLQICVTSNIFNVYYLEEVAKWIECQNKDDDFSFVYWNMLHDAPVHCITALPEVAKNVIADKLLSAEVNNTFKKEFKNIVDFMRTKSDITIDDIINNIKTMDQRKGDKIIDSHPAFILMLEALR